MILYGASGHCKVIIEILELNDIRNIKVWDDADINDICQYRVRKPDMANIDSERMIISIGNNDIRKRIAQHLDGRIPFDTAIHKGTNISGRAVIKEGTVVMAGVSINADAEIGRHAIINTNASIDHDCKIGDYCHISPNATLCGNVQIGEGTHVGAGTTVIPGIKIGQWCTIGAGSVVIRDIPDHSTFVGNPAREINK